MKTNAIGTKLRCGAAAALALCLTVLLGGQTPSGSNTPANWRTDTAWYNGKAEWAQYDAQRVIYGKPRTYTATIFTNKQVMDPRTTTKAADANIDAGVEVFKHNVSEMIETDNYTYRFLTTSFVRTDNLRAFKVSASSQEDCGSTYRQFIAKDGRITARQFGYFPDEGSSMASFAETEDLAFHDALTLTLRDYPFETAAPGDTRELALVQELTDNHWVRLTPSRASLRFVGIEQLDVPYGTVEAYHLRVTHPEVGGATESDYWFAVDDDLRHVLVQYTGPFGVKYQLKRLDWWAYWAEPMPK